MNAVPASRLSGQLGGMLGGVLGGPSSGPSSGSLSLDGPFGPGVLAHGVGSRHDLPLPLDLVLQGAAIALLASFLALGLLWTKPRFGGAYAGRVVGGPIRWLADTAWPRAALSGLTLAGGAFVLVVGAFGSSDADNPAPYVVYVLFWVGLAVASMLLGPVWRVINPLRLPFHARRALGAGGPMGRRSTRDYPEWLGHWPAAAGLFAFTWLELAAPEGSSPRVIALFLACHVVVHWAGAAVFGETWFENADPFEVYSTLLGHLGLFGRRADGEPVLRHPFEGLAVIPVRPGLVAVLAVCLGSTAFDSLGGMPAWAAFVQWSGVPGAIMKTAGLAIAISLVAASYVLATGRLAGAPPVDGGEPGGLGKGLAGKLSGKLGGGLAHSLVPVAAGYVVAHYYSLLAVEGQKALILLSDPFGTGADLLGLTGHTPNEAPAAPGLVAAVQVLSVLTGHLVGVVAAHDGALRLLPPRQRLTGQTPLLLLMVGYTAGGLALLFAG